MQNNIIKGLTLTLFAALLLGFVAYKAGYFDTNKSENGFNSETGTDQKEVGRKADSLKKIEMMSSSKTIILREHTVENEEAVTIETNSPVKSKELTHSSKSMTILAPEEIEQKKTELVPLHSNEK